MCSLIGLETPKPTPFSPSFPFHGLWYLDIPSATYWFLETVSCMPAYPRCLFRTLQISHPGV